MKRNKKTAAMNTAILTLLIFTDILIIGKMRTLVDKAIEETGKRILNATESI